MKEFLLLDEISAPSVQPSDDGLVVNPGIHVKGMSGSWDNVSILRNSCFGLIFNNNAT